MAQRLLQRVEELGDGLLALVEVAPGRLLRLFEAGVGQGEELLVVALERLAGELSEVPTSRWRSSCQAASRSTAARCWCSSSVDRRARSTWTAARATRACSSSAENRAAVPLGILQAGLGGAGPGGRQPLALGVEQQSHGQAGHRADHQADDEVGGHRLAAERTAVSGPICGCGLAIAPSRPSPSMDLPTHSTGGV